MEPETKLYLENVVGHLDLDRHLYPQGRFSEPHSLSLPCALLPSAHQTEMDLTASLYSKDGQPLRQETETEQLLQHPTGMGRFIIITNVP
jgi:hypothetical protein